MSRALILGSGGHTAIGWEVGVLHGLAAGGVDVQNWDYIVGSSAGSFVGARLAAGLLDATYTDLTSGDPAVERAAFAAGMGNSLPYLLSLRGQIGRAAVQAWIAGAVVRRFAGSARLGGLRPLRAVPAALGRALGPGRLTAREMTDLAALAVGLRQRQAACYEAYWAGKLMPEADWPSMRLGIIAFCSSLGQRRVIEATDGVPLARAVAASTSIPGLVGAVEIGGRHHIDCGALDSTSADLADGFDDVLILAPDANPGELARTVPTLEAGGSRVRVIAPSDPASFGEGVQHLDVSRVPAATALGVRDGREAVERLRTA
ncbi:patatin-like phospholipase family protein [Sinomonas sp. ASV486]|uniref:patatin-like phospholipase family protein n=1 Tax=Sinomonas sp. ASV486 TaxID=3051170 RepID=UPI0027DDFC7B|nr:patatin-like phospholipase family protein [Sinomonas sp. ASV486]MDQ4490007.1 patatin-like phospholipase family protein [Sinomonas sp. ASV486]